MKVLFWTDGFWPRFGGVETQGFQLIQGMRERGHEYIVYAQQDAPSWKEDEIYSGIPIKRFDFNGIIQKRDLKKIKVIQTHLERLIRDFQPDIVHLNAFVGGSAFIFSLCQKMFSGPTVLSCHSPYLHEGQFPSVIKNIVCSVDQICPVSHWVLEEMKKHLPQLKEKLKLIYNGLPLPPIAPLPLSFSPPTLLLLGRLSKEKGFSVGIDAFHLLKKKGSNAHLIIAGEGGERSSLEKQVDALGLRSSVRFKGVLSGEEVFSTFNEATMLLAPSLIESFGLVILEAMQMERPVIASLVEGIPEVVSEGKTALLVPPKDPKALCNAIEILLQNPERAIKMGKEGCKKSEQFTIGKHVLQYEQVYENLIKEALSQTLL